MNPEGEVNDFERVDYIHGHLDAALRAIEDGVNLKGYFHWSLMDNFEWAWGYQRRFGLYHVDFGTPAAPRQAERPLLRRASSPRESCPRARSPTATATWNPASRRPGRASTQR